MKPTTKSPEIDALLSIFSGRDRVRSIVSDTCTMCGKPATTFTDEISRKEFTISGMCQTCQDRVF